MKASQNIELLLFLFFVTICFNNCTITKYLEKDELILSNNTIIIDNSKENSKELYSLIKQQPNDKILGLIPASINLYNISSKKLGEAPILLNYRLAQKSASQIELFMKNKGYLDAIASYETKTKGQKAEVIYNIQLGNSYTINSYKTNAQRNNNLTLKIEEIFKTSKIKKGKIYNFDVLDNERNRIVEHLQNEGFYKFSKESIYYKVDTNQINKKVDIELVLKFNYGEEIKRNHRIGYIKTINIHLSSNLVGLNSDTTFYGGIHFIHNSKIPSFNIKRLAQKTKLKPKSLYNKYLIDKTYQSLAELNNFKKIEFEFTKTSASENTDTLSTNIYLSEGKKISYSLEVEATNNPQLQEGVSGSASISHYNLLGGSEHLQLKYKGSTNFNDLKESRLILDFSIPSLIGPFKMKGKSMTKTILSASINEQKRPEFIRNSITGSYIYQWKTKKYYQHKLSLINVSYVNFEGQSSNLNNISEYLIAKNYSDHLIPSTSYTVRYNNQDINKLKSHTFLKLHIESSGNILRAIANPLRFDELKNEDGEPILQENGNISYTLNIWNKRNIFTQYIKTSIDYRHYFEIDHKNSIATRGMGGIIYAYGNTDQAPFHKKFIAGGVNDLRGWQTFERPTGSMAPNDTLFTGGAKFISSIEYRFNVIKKLKGALFMDAGNIWEINSNYNNANFRWKRFFNDFAVNLGVGIRYDFQYFILRSDLGFAVREPYESKKWQWEKVSIQNAQLNIGLGYPF